jgi:carboxyl-terminal processing protease
VGILAGDRIIKVNGEIVAGKKMISDSIVNRLRGPRGTKVNVDVMRRNSEVLLNFDIIRDNIPLYSVDVSYILKDDIGYIKLNKFSATTEQEFVESVSRLRDDGMKKLILDLRENGGGYMNAAIFIADQFLNGTELIVYTQGKAREKQEFKSTAGGLCTDLGLTILIDENSASASEILAGAIQDNDRGTIVGRRSFGKGLVQEQKPLSDGSALRLTIARYSTPPGRSIQKSYSKGLSDYYDDINARYLHGEFENADSIKFTDSLKFTTPKGKTVYGGGGIMPDVFVPFDTLGISNYYVSVRNQGLLYRYSLKYADENRKSLTPIKSPTDFAGYLNNQDVLRKFIVFAAQEGVKEVPKDIKTSEKLLRVQLNAYIARNFLDNDGFFPIIQEIDNTLIRAMSTFPGEAMK